MVATHHHHDSRVRLNEFVFILKTSLHVQCIDNDWKAIHIYESVANVAQMENIMRSKTYPSVFHHFFLFSLIFSEPEPKDQSVHYCALCVVRPSSLAFNIFASTLKPLNEMRPTLKRKQYLNVLYQVCVFQTDRKKTTWPLWSLIDW